MSIYAVEPLILIQSLALKLREFEAVKPPKGSEFWKTAFFKELAPVDHENFWYIRCASLLRRMGKTDGIGVNRLKKVYGGRNRRGSASSHSAKGSGKIIRLALQQLEKANLVLKTEKNGRIISKEGRSLIERIAYSIIRTKK
ncbi:MAG TPA: 40S ribosomal protein S19 [Candidatus Lokiarchaeia archaeon]